jgi:hypothetical protein
MTDLSPAAQAIINAAVVAGGGYGRATPVLHARLAAALRAATDQVAPQNYDCAVDDRGWIDGAEDRNAEIREQLLAIAAELEAQ